MARRAGRSGDDREAGERRVRGKDRGDTLIEVLLAVVIIGAIFSAYFTAVSTGSKTSAAHRNYVTADALLRDYAEAAKSAARADCPTSATYTTTTTSLPPGFSVTNGTGFVGTDGVCPTDTSSVQEAELTVTLPGGTAKSIQLAVRTP
jgi:prepilin-type N-terminal cleavage/methylation domain-containing protein